MTNEEILKIALLQSSYDCNCEPEDFIKDESVVVLSKKHEKARVYLSSLPFECDMVSYGNNIVAQTSEKLMPVVSEFVKKYPAEHAFETPNIYALNDSLEKYGLKVCFMAEYFLPDVEKLRLLPCEYETRLLNKGDFANLYTDEWSNALCKERAEYDMLCIGAYDGEKLVGLAGASADCETMYQIGIDVLPEYRRKGIASALTSRLALEIIALGKVPFYCAAWCNIKSVRNAIKCGFRPAWVELTAKSADFVERLCKKESGVSILKLRENKNLADEAARWFHSKWGVSLAAYRESIDECQKNKAAVPQWYVAVDAGKIVGGLGVIENDFHSRKDLSPNVCALYVEEEYRRKGIAGKLLFAVCDDMKSFGIDELYLVTDHDSFYERYGWEFLCMVQSDGESNMTRMYLHKSKEEKR